MIKTKKGLSCSEIPDSSFFISIVHCTVLLFCPKEGENVPGRFKTECKKPGCCNLTDSTDGYCDEHRQEYKARQHYDDKRGSSAKRGYGVRWRRYRLWFLKLHPICAMCGRLATVVDHIIPHKGNMDLFWDMNNHQPLCKRCHDIKTAREDGGFGNSTKRGRG